MKVHIRKRHHAPSPPPRLYLNNDTAFSCVTSDTTTTSSQVDVPRPPLPKSILKSPPPPASPAPHTPYPYYGFLATNAPEMAATPYTISDKTSASNLMSLLLNSIRREIADMFSFVLPSLAERHSPHLTPRECHDTYSWCHGFISYFFASACAAEAALKSLRVPSTNRKALRRVIHALVVTSEPSVRALESALLDLRRFRTARFLAQVDCTCVSLAHHILTAFTDAYNFVNSIPDVKLPSGLMERLVKRMLAAPRGWKSKEATDYIANIAICLTRWMPNEKFAKHWMSTFSRRRVALRLPLYLIRYDEVRRTSEFEINHRPREGPRRLQPSPTKVTFCLPNEAR